MKTINHFEDFSGLYQLAKTLRFELIPQGKTLENINSKGLLAQDEHRAESYKKVKKIIDEYHKAFIEKSLSGFNLKGLDEYMEYFMIVSKDEVQKKKFTEIQAALRKQIAGRFAEQAAFNNLFKKELIKKELVSFVKNAEERKLIGEFDNFTTYFTGFHDNRQNIYSHEEKSTAIAFRLINQNLPKFIDNMRAFEKIKNSSVKEKFSLILSDNELGPIIQEITIESVFKIEYFNETLSQTGIDKYNHLIGGFTTEDGKIKKQGLNEYINLHNQNAKKEGRIPKLKPLYKQILSDRTTASFIPEQFVDDNELLETVEKFYIELNDNVFDTLKDILFHLPDFDINAIYLRNDASLTDISQKLFGDWNLIQKALNIWFENQYKGKARQGTEEFEEEQRKYFKNQDSFSIGYLNQCIQLLQDDKQHLRIETYFEMLGKTETDPDLLKVIADYHSIANDLLNSTYPTDKDLAQTQRDVDKIKDLLDSIKALQWFAKPLLGKGNEANKDERFYGEFAILWTTLDQITPVYNKVRNYMTRKPYSTEKIKLNFDNSYFLKGWKPDYETKAGLLFEKDGNYYLGINNKKLSAEEKQILKTNFNSSPAKRIILDFQKPDNKNIPRLFIRSKGENFAPAVENYQLPVNDIIEIYDNGKFKTEYRKIDQEEYFKSLVKLIDYFKIGFTKHKDFKHYSFAWKKTSEYKDVSEFYKDIEVSCYQVLEEKINWETLMNFVRDGKIYLFQIYNKDFSPHSKGLPNLHTMYWKMLFDPENLKDIVFKLNGQAEVFFRKSSIKPENIIVHKAGKPIENKNESNKKKESLFKYNLVKDRRYTVDKFQFHVPVTINFKDVGLNNINAEVNGFIQKNNDIHIIGIDRGERHLLYLSLIDKQGQIIEQYSLNEIANEKNDITYRTNYHNLLDKRAGSRTEERKNWKTIESIKELKHGYLSQVVHRIAELMVKYRAIIVLEDLNIGFIRGRQKVEKSVYQQFEKMLIDKLNYLTDKKKAHTEPGGILNAYQLTNKFESFQKMGKQCGFLFYVPAWNTSKMDPVTGFVNLLDTRYENKEKAKMFFEKFEEISFNNERSYFEFKIKNYSLFNAKAEGTRQNWTLCTYGTRIETFRNPEKNSQWDNREIELTSEFKLLFSEFNIDLGTDIREQVLQQSDKAFFEQLLHLLKLTVQMRNSITGTDTDYLISPVSNENGEFFDSRKADGNMPINADANGAYNIARKGLWIVQQIKNPDQDLKKLKLAISNKEWLQFAQSKG